MTTATVTQFYATEAEADVYLANETTWLALSTAVKEEALLSARYFIDSNYDCVVDYSDISDEVKYANSLLALDYTEQGDLFFVNTTSVKKKMVKAGKVEVETEYQSASKTAPSSLSLVTAVLKTVCNKTTSQAVRV